MVMGVNFIHCVLSLKFKGDNVLVTGSNIEDIECPSSF